MASALAQHPIVLKLQSNRDLVFPIAFIGLIAVILVPLPPGVLDLPYGDAKERMFDAFHDAYLTRLLERTSQNVSEAARQAGLDRSNFRRLLKRGR